MDVAVVGYKSSLGRGVVQRLKSRGMVVREIDREHLVKLTPVQLGEWLSGVSAVLDITTTPYLAKWTGKYQIGLYADRMVTIRAIVTSLRYCEPRPRMLLNLSNCMLYDKYDVHDDYSSQYDDGFLAEVAEMEMREVIKCSRVAPDMRIVHLRTGYVMSANTKAFKVLKNATMLGIAGIVDDGYQCMPVVHEDDLINVIEKLSTEEDIQGVFNVTIPMMASMNEMMESIRKYVKMPQLKLPKWMLKMFLGEALSMLEQNCKVLPQRLIDAGYEFECQDINQLMERCFNKK